MNKVLKDPVCGMIVLPDKGFTLFYAGYTVHFCSEYCQKKCREQPERYLATFLAPGYDEAVENRRIAYFSMEAALSQMMPTYSGGLGVLAGDTLKSCADLRVPVVGVTLVSRKGYFDQLLDEKGRQKEEPVHFVPDQFLRPLPQTIQVEVESRPVEVRAWQYDVVGQSGYVVPVILLDTDVETNGAYDRTLTDFLYGGDLNYRLAQEIVLGIGGVRMLRALGYAGIQKFHMNEGHASLLVLELLNWEGGPEPAEWDFEGVRNRSIFTTHTPVPAGHDQFDYDSVRRILGPAVPFEVLQMLGGQERLNMTLLGLNLCRYVNGVAKRHEEVSREMFPGYPIQHITNGVHSPTWTCESFKKLYDEWIPGWSNDPSMLRKALTIPNEKVWEAHAEAKAGLLDFIKHRTGLCLGQDVLTVGFARRMTPYKRADLIFSNVERLLEIAKEAGPLQFVFAGKAHPRDEGGKQLIERIFSIAQQLGESTPVVYLDNYDLEMARLLVSGVDLWLNTPQRPLEASGTSGMKAAHNGVPSLSTLDGWWIEGQIEGLTGWSIGSNGETRMPGEQIDDLDAAGLYWKLQRVVVPTFYRNRENWIDIMRHSIALNASFFNTHRMVQQYVTNAYLS
ncbi:MAG TPA: alpha-glucan family phosphorylase [Candidatus Binatia bacterium]|nr:alpha-glucan family phosphorylase [Candidatus Binatia bacterium]